MKHVSLMALCLGMLAACVATPEPAYTPPEASGLVGVRAFPAEGDVCQVIGENELTTDYLDDSATLVGCPQAETGAIADRIADGGQQVAVVGDWVLLSVPD